MNPKVALHAPCCGLDDLKNNFQAFERCLHAVKVKQHGRDYRTLGHALRIVVIIFCYHLFLIDVINMPIEIVWQWQRRSMKTCKNHFWIQPWEREGQRLRKVDLHNTHRFLSLDCVVCKLWPAVATNSVLIHLDRTMGQRHYPFPCLPRLWFKNMITTQLIKLFYST